MFLNITKANARITELEADKASLITSLAAKEKDFDRLVVESAEQAQAMADHTAKIEALKAEQIKAIEALKAEHAQAIEAKAKETEAAKTSAGKQAANIVASLGIPEGTIPAEGAIPVLAPDVAFNQFNSLSNPEDRRAFWTQHRDEILKHK